MATVNFQCGHCHSLMAVGQEFLGQQVRCPHCQQVVVAPAPSQEAAPAPEMPIIELPRLEEHESIFTPPDSSHEDVFGDSSAPRVELPTEPAFPRLGLEEPTLPGEPNAPRRPAATDQPTLTYTGPEDSSSASVTEVVAPDAAAALAEAEPQSVGEGPPSSPSEDGLPLPITHKPRVARSNPWVIPLIIAPLAFYSFMATLYILDTQFLHFFTPPPPPHPLEMIPDFEGDNKGDAKHTSKRGPVETHWKDPLQPLPPQLLVPLGGTLAVGDLEVTPLNVERKRISFAIGKTREPATEESLALYLRLRNRSKDVVFKPMDRFFARSRPTGHNAIPQYTILEMGDRKFYGGPLTWVPLAVANTPDTSAHIEYVHQQVVNQELKPGEEMTTFVCTNPQDRAVKALDSYQGPLLWRVQLRRGLVKWTTRLGVEREDSVTAVVGVEFTSAAVKKASD
jgi:hypothetical protein